MTKSRDLEASHRPAKRIVPAGSTPASDPRLGRDTPGAPTGSGRLWNDLEQARGAYHQGEETRARKTVRRLLHQLEESGSPEGDVSLKGLRGSAYTLLGRIHEARDEPADAREAFEAAVEWFDRELPELSEVPGRLHSDYGRALLRVDDREREAREHLEQALGLHYTHASTYRSLGEALLRLGEPLEAEEKLRIALELVPWHPETLTDLAESLKCQERSREASAVLRDLSWVRVKRADLEEAEETATEALALDPGPESHAVLGSVLRLAERPKEAVKHLKAAVHADPELAWAHTELGLALRELGRLGAALKALDKAERLEPGNYYTLFCKGETLALMGRFETALAALDRSLEIRPDQPRVLSRKGDVLRILGRFEEALSTLDRAIELDPDDVFALDSKAEVLRSEGEPDQALEILDRVLELEPHDVFALATRGQILSKRGRLREALELLERAAGLTEDLGWVHAELGRVLIEVDRLEDALEALNRALEIQSDDPFALAHRGDALRRIGRFAEALEDLEEALEILTDDPFTLARLGETLRMLDRYDEALEALDRALELKPGDSFVLASRAEILRLQGRDEEALADLDRALEAEPDYAFALATKGQILRDRGELEEARGLFDHALAGDDGDPDLAWVHAERAMLLWQLGDLDEALAAYERAIALEPANAPSLLALQGELLRVLERYDEARTVLEGALETQPDNFYALGVLGGLLLDGAEYEAALERLTRATELDPDCDWCWGLAAVALLYLGPERAQEGEEVCRRALEIDETPGYRSLLADFLHLQGRIPEAEEEYRRVVAYGEEAGFHLDADELATVGWCHFRLRQWDAAVDRLAASVRSSPGVTAAHFDLPLTLLCWGRHELALQEYERALDLARSTPAYRRRGLYHVALADLDEVVQSFPELEDAPELREVRETLREALEGLDAEVRSGSNEAGREPPREAPAAGADG